MEDSLVKYQGLKGEKLNEKQLFNIFPYEENYFYTFTVNLNEIYTLFLDSFNYLWNIMYR